MILIESSAWNNWFASPLSKALQYCIWCRSPVSTALGEWESWVIIKWKRGLVEVLSPQNSLESSFLELVLVPLKQKKTCTENFHVKEVIHFMHIVFFPGENMPGKWCVISFETFHRLETQLPLSFSCIISIC